MTSTSPKHMSVPYGYAATSRQPLNCLMFILPVLLFYHISISISNPSQSMLARRDISRVLGYFGLAAWILPPLLIVGVLLGQHIARRDKWRIDIKTLMVMVVESALWILPLVAFGLLSGQLATGNATWWTSPGYIQLVGDIGAGVYEEFIFRLILISFCVLVFVDVFGLRENYITTAAIVIGAILFGLYHLPVGVAETPWDRFIMRVPMGILWGTAYVYRGFGIAVGTHVAWNIFVNAVRFF